jgi:hypothetical protein
MKVLFVMKEPGEVRMLGSVLRLLDQRGHRVHLAFQGIKTSESHAALRKLADECPGITFGESPSPGKSQWTYLARSLRFGIDYLRYLEPLYAEAPKLRANAEKQAPLAVRRLGRVASLAGPHGVSSLRHVLQRLERCIEPSSQVERFVESYEPDVFLVTPLVGVGSSQADFLRAAQRLGIRTAYPVLSWDNLTTKGLVRDVPDLVLVWNEIQADEAVELHAIPRDRIRVAGAWSWDHWFDWRSQRTREEFCREVGLRHDRPIVLYVGSSWWVIRDEVGFVRRWTGGLRAHGGVLADAGILVRPHPMRRDSYWSEACFDDPQVAVWPRFGEQILDDVARQNFFDAIYYADAVFGINTSAQIESAIVGRPVHTLLSDEYHETQQGTIHFNYLKDGALGHLYVARSLEEHSALLERSLRGDLEDGRTERFVRHFARPFGLDVPATPLFVDAIEELAAAPAPTRRRGPALAPAARLALLLFAVLARRAAARRRTAKQQTPDRDLRLALRGVAETDSVVVAGPWLGDEIGELLYWIPFLRWVQTTNFGLAGRLWIVSQSASRHWYRGLDARVVAVDELVPPSQMTALAESRNGHLDAVLRERLQSLLGTQDFHLVPARLVANMRADLARQRPEVRVQNRLLDFAPLPVAELPAHLELPGEFVAVRFAFDAAYAATDKNRELAVQTIKALTETLPVVVLALSNPLRRELEVFAEAGALSLLEATGAEIESAVLARACGFLGSYGATVYAAALLGVPALGLYSGPDGVAAADLQVVSSFLDRPAFGRVETLDVDSAISDPAEIAGRLLASVNRTQRIVSAIS